MAGAVIEALMGNQASRLITPFGELSPEEATERIDLCVLKIGYLVAQSLYLFEKLGVVGFSIGATLRPLLNLCRHLGSDAVPAFGEANPIENASAGGSGYTIRCLVVGSGTLIAKGATRKVEPFVDAIEFALGIFDECLESESIK